jgi:hypothetical protein
VVPALNELFDITTTRTAAALRHPPLAIFALLGGIDLLCGLLVGKAAASKARRNWLYSLVFAATLSGRST